MIEAAIEGDMAQGRASIEALEISPGVIVEVLMTLHVDVSSYAYRSDSGRIVPRCASADFPQPV